MLLEVEVPVVTNAQCETTMTGITDSMICAGGEAGKDGCQVDHIAFYVANSNQEIGNMIVLYIKSIFVIPGRLRRSSDLQERESACSYW